MTINFVKKELIKAFSELAQVNIHVPEFFKQKLIV